MNSEEKNKLLIFCIPYFGKWPDYTRLFIESCRWNKCAEFLFFSNIPINVENLPDNVKVVHMEIEEFFQRAEKVLEMPIKIKDTHKVCDFRPFFGLIFSDYFSDYKFWGYCDIDIVLGDIGKVVNRDYLANAEIFSAHHHQVVGHFTILKNNDKINNLCFKIEDYENRINKLQTTFMDEGGFADVLRAEKDIKWLKPKALSEELNENFAKYNITYKHDANIAFMNQKSATLTLWENGHAYFKPKDKFIEVLYVHFMGLKRSYFWKKFNPNKNYEKIYFSRIGFSEKFIDENSLLNRIKWARIYINLHFRITMGKIFYNLFGKDLKRKIVLFLKNK